MRGSISIPFLLKADQSYVVPECGPTLNCHLLSLSLTPELLRTGNAFIKIDLELTDSLNLKSRIYLQGRFGKNKKGIEEIFQGVNNQVQM